MKLFAIREHTRYGEYVHIVRAKDKVHAKKLVKLNHYTGRITETKILKLEGKPMRIFVGGYHE